MDEDEVLDRLPAHLRNKALEALSADEGLTDAPVSPSIRSSPTALWWFMFVLAICWVAMLVIPAIALLLVFPPLGFILALTATVPAVVLLNRITRKDTKNG